MEAQDWVHLKEISTLLRSKEIQDQASAIRQSLDEDPDEPESNFIISMVVVMQHHLESIIFVRRIFSNTDKAKEIFERELKKG